MTLPANEVGTDRRVPIGDARNARHMGGYAAGDGRITRTDRLFRSGWFALPDGDARNALAGLDIRQVVDFRTADELGRKPLAIGSDDGVEIISAPILSGNMRAYINGTAHLAPDQVDCRAAMIEMYADILDNARDAYATMFSGLARGEGGAMILCSAGKDRTGMGAALLLSALGVSRDDVARDFLASADLYRGYEEELARQHGYERTGHDLSAFRDVFTVLPEYLDAAWSTAERRAGSMANLAADLAGGSAVVARLRDRFTEPG